MRDMTKEILSEYREAMQSIDMLEEKKFVINGDYLRLLKNDFLLISKTNRNGYNKMYLCYLDQENVEGHVFFSLKYRSNRRQDGQYSLLRSREDSLKGKIIKAFANHKIEDLEMLEGVIITSDDV